MQKSAFLLLSLWLTACLSFCCLSAHAQSNTTNKGTEFWSVWMDHISLNSQMILYITSDVSTTGSVSITDGSFSQSFNVTANQVTFINIPPTALLTSQGTFNKGIHITSQKPIVVYAHIYYSAVSGATLVLPVAALAKDYYTISYTQQSNSTGSYSAFDVIATEDNTSVQITPSVTLIDGSVANKSFTVNLNKGQVYQGLSTSDVTGTRVQSISNSSGSCKRIAVYSGSSKLYIGCPNNTSDNLFQQVYPTASWGKNYVTVPLSGRAYDVYRIIYSDPTAHVTLNGTPISQSQLVNNFYYEFNSSQTNIVSSDKPIQVVQYAITQGNTLNCTNLKADTGDPEMIFLTPIEQGLNHVTLYSTSKENILYNYINVIIPTAAAGSFTLDGGTYAGFKPVPNNTAYSYAQISVGAGTHNIAASDNFNAIAYGFGNVESYGYAAGTNLQDLNEYVLLDNTTTSATSMNGCTGLNYIPQVTVPYKTTSIKWSVDGTLAYTDSDPQVVATPVSKTGTQLYTYQYSKATTFTQGSHTIVASVFDPIVDACGSYTDVELDFTISDPPVAKFTFSSPTCLGDATTFTDNSSTSTGSITSWLWDFGDGSTETHTDNKPFPHTYTKPGDYQVRVALTNDNSCSTISAPQTVHVGPHPVASFAISSPNCAALAVTFTDKSTTADGTLNKWVWDFGDGSTETHTDNKPFPHTYTTAGNYTATLQVFNKNNCSSDVLPQPLTINPIPVADFTTPDICLSDVYARFTDQSTINGAAATGLTYLWNFGDPNAAAADNTSAEQNPKHKYNQNGTYTVTLTVTSASGCASVVKQKSFTVNGAVKNAAFSVENSSALCSSNTVIFDDQSTVYFGQIVKVKWWFDYDNHPADTVVFYKSRGDIPANGKYTHNYGLFNTPLTKTYHVHEEVYSGVNCFLATDQNITINANPKIDITSPGVICQDAGGVQIAEDKNGFTGTGTFSGTGVSASGVFNTASVSTGTYTIAYHFTAASGCGYDTTIQVTVKPVPVVTAIAEQNVLSGGTVTLEAKASISDNTKLTYKWTPVTGLDHDDILNPVASPAADTRYVLHVYSAYGCIATAQTLVTVLQAPVIPNTFTPNGDGINDIWNIKYLDSYHNCTVDIFNRYGEKVYSSIGYAIPWDGRYKGVEVPVGTYYYIINPKNGRQVIAGWVAILK